MRNLERAHSTTHSKAQNDGKRLRDQSEDEAGSLVFVSVGTSLFGIDRRRPCPGTLWLGLPFPSSRHAGALRSGCDFIDNLFGTVRRGTVSLEKMVHRSKHNDLLFC